MPRTRVKICCIQSIQEASVAIGAGADAIGLVGAMPSGPGPIADEVIADITGWVPPPVASFLLSSETTVEGIVAHIRRTRPSTLQLVDHVEPDVYQTLKVTFPELRLVQVIHVEDETALTQVEEVRDHVHAILLDSGRPNAEVKEFGGTGRTHDWDVSAEIVRRAGRPVFLAGGLTPVNVADAITRVRPFGVDLCSGVRTDGRLDKVKLDAFFAAVSAF